MPRLRGEKSPDARGSIYGAYRQLQRAVIRDGWRFILYPRARVARLHHIAAEPDELRDLAANPVHAGRRAAHFQRLRTLQKELADPLDLTTAFRQSLKSNMP